MFKILTVLKRELTAEEYHELWVLVQKSAINMSQKVSSFSAVELIEEYDIPLDASAVFNILKPLVKSGQLKKSGGRRTTRYSMGKQANASMLLL